MNKLQESRKDRNLSTRSLAAIVGINHMAINYYENEKRDFNTKVLKSLRLLTNLSVCQLFLYLKKIIKSGIIII
ncbi:MAG: helix-turn-helix transcriptional regulator [Bacilli bacterium]|nr:helix-turn-helix transcriptional regulator [Bacilli bacterium]